MPDRPILVHTYTGKVIDLNNLKPKDVDIEYIAHSLSNTCRFMGHVRTFYSTAEHSVNMSLVGDQEIAYELLHHDDGEALTGDVTSPLKHSGNMDWYINLEKRKVNPVVAKKLGLRYNDEINKRIKLCDNRMLATEVSQLMNKPFAVPFKPYKGLILRCLPPLEAKQAFLNRHYELKAKNKRS